MKQPNRYEIACRFGRNLDGSPSHAEPYMFKSEEGSWVAWRDYRKLAEGMVASTIHTCSKGCEKPGCGRRLHDQIEELQVEVERLTNNLKAEQNAGWDMVAENANLKAEVARLRAASFVTAVPAEQYDRVVKAGDAMAKLLSCCGNPQSEVRGWNAAKEGKQS